MNITNLRPGVYSRYDISSLYSAPASRRFAAVVAKAKGGTEAVPEAFTSYQRAKEVFSAPEDAFMLGALAILFSCGVSKVYAVPVGNLGYDAAAAATNELEDVAALVCDCADPSSRAIARTAVMNASGAKKERLAFLGVPPEEAEAAATAMDCERVVLATPAALPRGFSGTPSPFYTAAALAGTVLAANDPAYNFSGLSLSCLEPPQRLAEDTVQALLAAGATIVEPVGEAVQIVRALTTKAGSDRALGPINTILIIDDVMASMRLTLAQRLRASRISTQSRDSILAQVLVELASKQDEGIIESFEPPKLHTHEEDPTVCIVELSFQVAHVLSQIHVEAFVQV